MPLNNTLDEYEVWFVTGTSAGFDRAIVENARARVVYELTVGCERRSGTRGAP